MKYRFLFLVSIIIFVFLSIANFVVFSTGRIQIGTPSCEIWNSPEQQRCATVKCIGEQPSGSTCYDDSNNQTTLDDQVDTICELRPGRCVVIPDQRLVCDPGNRSASYGRDCDGTVNTISSDQISCPISCTCPQPIGEKPCRRATWNTETCRWNDAICYYEDECNLSLATNNNTEFSPDESNIIPDPSCCSYTEASQCELNGGEWDYSTCTCISPIVIDVLGNGFNLTNAQNGVLFDITNSGTPRRVSWTSAGSDDAWLALDRNGNGTIDKGAELFGSSTPQPALSEGETKNGFRALAVFDKPARGGNNDNQIDSRDAIYAQLKLWQDANHNGISEANELHGISELGLRIIELNYSETRRQDENGNWFRFRSKVRDAQGAQIGRWAWDVFLQVQE